MRRRLLRYAFTVCSAVSLVLCVAVCVLWVRSYFVVYGVDRTVFVRPILEPPRPDQRRPHQHEFIVYCGVLSVEIESRGGETGITAYKTEWSLRSADVGTRLALAESLSKFSFRRGGRYTRVLLPMWVLALPLAVPPLLWLHLARRRRRRQRIGLCATCGYDLRAHAKGERCPECGTMAV